MIVMYGKFQSSQSICYTIRTSKTVCQTNLERNSSTFIRNETEYVIFPPAKVEHDPAPWEKRRKDEEDEEMERRNTSYSEHAFLSGHLPLVRGDGAEPTALATGGCQLLVLANKVKNRFRITSIQLISSSIISHSSGLNNLSSGDIRMSVSIAQGSCTSEGTHDSLLYTINPWGANPPLSQHR